MSTISLLLNKNLTPKTKLHELKYWYFSRRMIKFIPWVARKLPRKLKYYVVLNGMVTGGPDGDPMSVTGMQLLELWKDKSES